MKNLLERKLRTMTDNEWFEYLLSKKNHNSEEVEELGRLLYDRKMELKNNG